MEEGSHHILKDLGYGMIAAALPGIITAAVEYIIAGGSSGWKPLGAAIIGGGLITLILMAIKTPDFPSTVVEYIMTVGPPRWILLGIAIGASLTMLILMAITTLDDSPSEVTTLDDSSSEEDRRIFSPKTSAELVAKLKGLTEIQAERIAEPYLGLWLEEEGVVTDISKESLSDQIAVYMFEDKPGLALYFDASTWGAQVGSFDVGDRISAIGKIKSIQRTWDSGIVSLEECELVSQ